MKPGTFVTEALKRVGHGTDAEPSCILGMDVRPQRNNWSCGPAALRHCFMKWGIDISWVDDPTRLTGATRAKGVDEFGIAQAAARLGSAYAHHYHTTADCTKRSIHRSLELGRALVINTENEQHWVACLHHSQRGYLIFDSSRPGPVIQLRGWKWLKKQMRAVDGTGKSAYYAGSVSKPRGEGIHQAGDS